MSLHTLIVIGASVGGLDALGRIVRALPADLAATVLVVSHIGTRDSILPQLLGKSSALPVRHARDLEPLLPSVILLAPPDRHLTVRLANGQAFVELTHGPKENYTRPAIDPLFRSAAEALGRKVIGVILTGHLDDGTVGLQAIKACGGMAVVQEPDDAVAPSMPRSAIEHVQIDLRLPLDEIGPALAALAAARVDAGLPQQIATAAPAWIGIENQFARGEADMDELEKIATPSTYTCPECQGTLWEIRNQHPARFRCHTGHSFTTQVLQQLQTDAAEEALWAAVRALQEKQRLLRDLARKSIHWQHAGAAGEYEKKADEAHRQAEVLRSLLLEKKAPTD